MRKNKNTKDKNSILTAWREQPLRCLQKQGVRAVFKSETTVRFHLLRTKEAVEPTKQNGVRSTRFPVNVVKSTLARRADPCRTKLRNINGTSK